jgi:hypothetical protein
VKEERKEKKNKAKTMKGQEKIMISKAFIDMVLKRKKNEARFEYLPPAPYASMQPTELSYATRKQVY